MESRPRDAKLIGDFLVICSRENQFRKLSLALSKAIFE